MKNIVVYDPKGEFWDGAVIQSHQVHVLEERGGCSLPCIVEDFGLAGFAGFASRAWGSGWNLPALQGQHFAPLAIYKARPGPMTVHWAVRLIPTSPDVLEAVKAGRRLEGNLRLSSPPGRGNLAHASIGELQSGQFSALELTDLGQPDEDGGWNVTRAGSFSSGAEGLYGLSLYGHGQGVRVVWVAVSLSP